MATYEVADGKQYLDPYNLPRTSAFFITLPDGRQEGVVLPVSMPHTYEESRKQLIRTAIAVHDPRKQDDVYLEPATEAEEAQFMVREYGIETAALQAGREYHNRYDAIVRMAELALTRGMPEQGIRTDVELGQDDVPPAVTPEITPQMEPEQPDAYRLAA